MPPKKHVRTKTLPQLKPAHPARSKTRKKSKHFMMFIMHWMLSALRTMLSYLWVATIFSLSICHKVIRRVRKKKPMSTLDAEGATGKDGKPSFALMKHVWNTKKLKSYLNVCEACQAVVSVFNFQLVQYISTVNGGEQRFGNLAIACARCANSIGVRNLDEFKMAEKPRQRGNPNEPVWNCEKSGRLTFNRKQRCMIWERTCGMRFDGRCFICEQTITPFEFDAAHLIALANNGSNSLDNLVASCATCNRSCGTRSVDEFKLSTGMGTKIGPQPLGAMCVLL